MKLGKINFFKRIYLAITDFRMYPYALKEKLSTAIGYFFKFLILISVIIAAFTTSNLFKELPSLLDTFERNIPEFNLVNGKLQVEENRQQELNENTYLVVNSEKVYNKINELVIEEENIYDYYVLVLSDATVVGIGTEEGVMELGRIQYEPTMNLSKEELVNDWKIFNESNWSKVLVWISITFGMFFALFMIKIWNMLMYIISAYIINIMFGLKLKITEYLKVVIYASTLPSILSVVALLVVGNVSEAVNFISVLVSCVYIFYALRAIKLDSLILGGSGKNAEEKIKNALAHAQEELEKQLEELEKKEKDSRDEEKKDIEKMSQEIKEKEEKLLKAQKEYDEAIKKAISMKDKKDEKASDDESKTAEEDKKIDENQNEKKK